MKSCPKVAEQFWKRKVRPVSSIRCSKPHLFTIMQSDQISWKLSINFKMVQWPVSKYLQLVFCLFSLIITSLRLSY